MFAIGALRRLLSRQPRRMNAMGAKDQFDGDL
jgi:hypothetical protein